MDEDRFRYVEQDPPLTGADRKRDYKRQHHAWRYAADNAYREYQLAWRNRRRARMLAVAREYGATLAVVLGLMVGGAARAQEPVADLPSCWPENPTREEIDAVWARLVAMEVTQAAASDGRMLQYVVGVGDDGSRCLMQASEVEE